MLDRVDAYPDAQSSPGSTSVPDGFYPFGATLVPGGVNFSIFSRHATSCTLVLFEQGDAEPFAELPFPDGVPHRRRATR